MDLSYASFLALGKIVWIDLLLSADNAVVIALACRGLAPHLRNWGIGLGSCAAIILRIAFAIVITSLMGIPYLMVFGGILLLWIAIKLVRGDDEENHTIKASENLWRAVATISMADAVMSLDNVVAISAAANGDIWLFVFGLVLSIPLIIFGANIITNIIDRFPLFVWAGAALLGWIAGEMIAHDHGLIAQGLPQTALVYYGLASIGAGLVLLIGWLFPRRAGAQK